MNLRLALLSVVVFLSACGGVDETLTDGGSSTGGLGSASCTDSWSGYGATFFASRCASCHHHAGQFTTAASVRSALVEADISNGSMPQGAALSAAEKARVLAYLGCGAP
jgi:hypothetical protein